MGNQASLIPPPEQEPLLAVHASPLKRLVIGLVLITAVVGTLGVYQQLHTRSQALRHAENTSTDLANILQQSIGAMLHKTDLTLRHVVDEVEHQSATGGIQKDILGKFIERQFKLMPELESLRVCNELGAVLQGSGNFPAVSLNIADRDYFSYLRDHPDAEMVISKPIIGKISKKRVIACARSIKKADGSFGGIVYAVLPLQLFYNLFEGVPVGAHGSVSLRRDDLTLITRYSPKCNEKDVSAIGSTIISSAWQSLLNQGNIQNGTYTSVSVTDGISRIYSYSRIHPYPLYINVGLALDDVLVETNRQRLVVAGFFVLFLNMAALLVWQSHRNWQKTFAAEKELKRNYARLELMQEVSQYHAENVQDLLDFTLNKVVALTESSIGYIYHYNEEEQQFVLNTWSKDVMPACRVAEPQAIYQLEKTGLWGEVVRQRRPIMINDYSSPLDLKKGYPEGHVHLTRFLSIPVFDNDKIMAVVGVANKATPYDQGDLLQLTLMMEGIWKIAARLKLEERILRAGHEWQSTFDAIQDSISLIDADQRVMRCNKATCTLLQRNFADIINKPCWMLFHGADAPIPDCPMVKAKCSLHSETAIIQHNGRWLEISVNPILSDQDEFVSAVQIVRDITESTSSELALRASLIQAQRFSTALDNVSAYIYMKDLQSRYVYANRPTLELFGCTADELRGCEDTRFFSPETVKKLRDVDSRVFAGEKTSEEIVSITAEGRHVYWEIKSPIYEDQECTKIWGLLGISTDITAQKQAEEHLREMQTQLLQQDKLATIGQLAAGVAHEINNPIGFISSNMISLGKYIEKYNRYIDLIEQEIRAASSGILPEMIQDLRRSLKLDYVMRDVTLLIDENNDGIDRVKRIVQDLRTFSRPDSSAIGSAELNSCMDSTINIVINEIKYAAELKREYGDLPKISCNVQQINQVFMNLLINAAHAIQAKGEEVGEIVIRSWSDDMNVFVSVSDTGCGIPPENFDKIFNAFYTTKEVGKGTGLGLSISSGIIRKHGGEIMLSSEVGVGSTFTIRLPIMPPQTEKRRQ